jgi:hypothetical protein
MHRSKELLYSITSSARASTLGEGPPTSGDMLETTFRKLSDAVRSQ